MNNRETNWKTLQNKENLIHGLIFFTAIAIPFLLDRVFLESSVIQHFWETILNNIRVETLNGSFLSTMLFLLFKTLNPLKSYLDL